MDVFAEKIIPNLILQQYDKAKCLIASWEQKKEFERVVGSFHMKAAMVVKLNDEYFCGMRAEHFLVEYGYSEDWGEGAEGEVCVPLLLVTANHKGNRVSLFFTNGDPILDKFFTALDESIGEADL